MIMGIIMVAMLAFGGSFAYFTATAEDKTGSFTTANLSLTSGGGEIALTTSTPILPGDWIWGNDTTPVNVTLVGNTTTVNYIVYAHFNLANTITMDDGSSILDETVDVTGSWKAVTGKSGYYYQEVTKETNPANFQFSVKFKESIQSNRDETDGITDNTSADVMKITVELTIEFASIQAQGQTANSSTSCDAAFAAVASRTA